MRVFKKGDTVWHGFRYWKMEALAPHEVIGWNTRYIPYRVVQITAKRIIVAHDDNVLHLNRQTMERQGKQYHTRFHEYFYADKPEPNSKDWNWEGSRPNFVPPTFSGNAPSVLGLTIPYSKQDVKRAYKRLAKTAHPDLGGSHQEFIKLQQAYTSALRFAS